MARARKKVRQPHGDASVRMGAAEKLYSMGTPEALRALLDRFTIAVSPSVEDEQEKQEVCDWLVAAGAASVAPLEDFLKTERNVYWPLVALRRILPRSRYADRIAELLNHFWENPPASPEPLVQLIRAVEDVEHEEMAGIVGRFLDDMDDDVVLAAADFFFARPEEVGRELVLKCYVEIEDRARVRAGILDGLARHGWSVTGFRPAVEESLPEGYSLTRGGRVRTLAEER